jgi:hypothetical protein
MQSAFITLNQRIARSYGTIGRAGAFFSGVLLRNRMMAMVAAHIRNNAAISVRVAPHREEG